MKHLSAAALILSALALPSMAGEWADAATLEGLKGTWVSPAPEPWYGGFGTREFVFADGQWSLIFTHALDPAMTLRTFQFRTGGGYAVTGPSSVPGAFEATFDEDWKRLTQLTAIPEVAAGIGLDTCGLTVNLEADISQTGCAAWPPVADCGQDFDLLAMDPQGVYFGVRPADNDMCTPEGRPTALLPPVVAR
ncbi:MAG: hypothetical protein ACT4OK_13825 [Gemmobacter sp.]